MKTPSMNDAERRALNALEIIIPLFEKHALRWVITTGFACYVHGVERELTDIDIDVEGSKDDPGFRSLIDDLRPLITQDLKHFVDVNYDNWGFEVTIEGQLLDICSTAEMNIFDKTVEAHVPFYPEGFPAVERGRFHGLYLPLMTKEMILKNKRMLTWQRETDYRDIAGLSRLLGCAPPII